MREHSRSSELESEMSQKRERWLWTWSRHKLKRAIVQLAACSADERLSPVTVTQTDARERFKLATDEQLSFLRTTTR